MDYYIENNNKRCEIMKIREKYTCPLELAYDILKGKWKMVILYQIHWRGRASLSELENDIIGINQKMLLQHLKELMKFGFVDKFNYDGYPLRVEYFLTENRGKKVVKVLEMMQDIGKDILDEMEK